MFWELWDCVSEGMLTTCGFEFSVFGEGEVRELEASCVGERGAVLAILEDCECIGGVLGVLGGYVVVGLYKLRYARHP